MTPTDVDLDVEGHGTGTAAEEPRSTERPAPTTAETPDDESSDTEGHLYRLGPTTEGEFARRAPGENPHGER